MDYTPTKQIAKEIKSTLAGIPGLKLSVTSNVHRIDIAIISFNYECLTDASREKGYTTLNQYCFMESERITREAKTVFQLVDEIIKKYHWDKSDSMTDYFNCAFYYGYSVGRFDKPFTKA